MKKKKILIGLAVVVGAVVGAAALGAFEAHVVNVTATIENALAVNTNAIDFGTVFPQEVLHEDLQIRLSDSFVGEDRVDDVQYRIVQKLKPVPEGYTGGHYEDISNVEGATGEYYPSLCEYLSKHKNDDPADEQGYEQEVDAFHAGRSWTGEHVMYDDIAYGYLSKAEGDTVDLWDIDLDVPCFDGYCAQDWTHDGWELDPSLMEATFGCDLWVEVEGISEAACEVEGTVGEGWSDTAVHCSFALGAKFGDTDTDDATVDRPELFVQGGESSGKPVIVGEDREWIDEQWYDFSVAYDGVHTASITVNGETAGATDDDIENPSLGEMAITVKTTNEWQEPGTKVAVKDLMLNGCTINPDNIEAVKPADGRALKYIQLSGLDFSGGFTLTGKIMFDWATTQHRDYREAFGMNVDVR